MPILPTALTIKDLPPPPPGKLGWPWTEQSQPLPDHMPDGSEWPRISIVTPSYNYGQFLEETIRSVLLQGYPNLEYIIMDGGSKDNSVEIIRKYEPWLQYWVSEPDNGQTDAIQKGFSKSTGVVWNWLNSDDILEKNALQKVADAFIDNPHATLFFGELIFFDKQRQFIEKSCFKTFSELVCLWETWSCIQPAIFMSSSACQEANGFDASLNYVMDYYLYTQLALLPGFSVCQLNTPIARFRMHSLSKTGSKQFPTHHEVLTVFDNLAEKYPSLLPKGWQKSRARFTYHVALTSVIDSAEAGVSLYSFVKTSVSFLPVIWNYRFFWIVLLKTILGLNPLRICKDI